MAGGRLAEVAIRHNAIPRFARHGATPCNVRKETVGQLEFFILAKSNLGGGIYSGATQHNGVFKFSRRNLCFAISETGASLQLGFAKGSALIPAGQSLSFVTIMGRVPFSRRLKSVGIRTKILFKM